MSDWKSDDHRADRWRDDARHDVRGRTPEDRSFGQGGSRQDRLEGADYGGMGTQGAEWRHTDSGGGFQGEERFGHSGGVDSGYGGQSGKAGWGPLSQGSTYGQGDAGWGHSGWESGHRSQRPRGPGRDRDYGFRGQGGGGQQWGGERGTYGRQDGDRSAQRSRDRTTQYDPSDSEGFIAYGRAYGEARDRPHDTQGHATDGEPRRDHDHEPGYRDWRDRQLAGHDADYRRWRDEQTRRYDEDYRSYRNDRHEAFSKGFQDWRDKATAGSTAATAGSGGAPASQASPSGGTAFDVVSGNVRDVTDGGEGHASRDTKPDDAKH